MIAILWVILMLSYSLKMDPTICTYKISKILYNPVHYKMFRWQPPPSTEGSTCANQTTTVVSCLFLSCLIIHTQSDSLCIPVSTELAGHSCAGVQTPIAVKHHGNPEGRSWHLHNIWHRLMCVYLVHTMYMCILFG